MIRLSSSVVVLLFVCSSIASAQPAKKVVAEAKKRETLVVMNLVAERGIDEALIRLLNELLLTQFTQTGNYAVIGGSDVQAIISTEAQRQAVMGCTDVACLAELGGALGADLLAVSNIGRIGDFYLLNVKILNVKTASVVRRWSEQVQGLENQLMLAVRKSVAKVSGVELSADGSMEVIDASPGDGGGPTVGATASAGFSIGTPELAPIILWGVGGAVLATGIIFGVQASSHFDNATNPEFIGAQHEIGKGETSQVLANVSFGVGAAAMVAGLGVWLFAGGSEPPPVSVGPASAEGGAAVFFSGRL
jgi:hypothetical protein